MANKPLYAAGEIFNIGRLSKYVCSYCGAHGNIHRDHVIPTCYLREKRRYEGDWLVPACAECNTTLGAELIFNVPDRAAWIAIAYRARYRKLLCSVHWDEDELAEVGYALRKYIEQSQEVKKNVSARIDHLDMVSRMPINYLANLRPIIDRDDEDVAEFVDDDVRIARERRKALLRRAAKIKQANMDEVYFSEMYGNSKK